MKKLLLSIAVLLLSTSVYAATGDAGNKMKEVHPDFSKLDINHDGFIDKKEAKADKMLSKKFNTVAVNGKIDQHAYDSWKEQKSMN